MTAIHLVQLACERPKCPTRYPYEPSSTVGSVGALRAVAAKSGWEVRRGTKHGRDVCPECRVNEIRSLSGMAEVGEPRER